MSASFKTSSVTSTPAKSRSSNHLGFAWKMSPRELLSTSGRSLLLNALLIGIAPRADFQTPANPAQPFRRIGGAIPATNSTLLHALHLIRHHRTLRLIEKLLLDDWIRGHGLHGRRWFSFHGLKTTVACLCNHAAIRSGVPDVTPLDPCA